MVITVLNRLGMLKAQIHTPHDQTKHIAIFVKSESEIFH